MSTVGSVIDTSFSSMSDLSGGGGQSDGGHSGGRVGGVVVVELVACSTTRISPLSIEAAFVDTLLMDSSRVGFGGGDRSSAGAVWPRCSFSMFRSVDS